MKELFCYFLWLFYNFCASFSLLFLEILGISALPFEVNSIQEISPLNQQYSQFRSFNVSTLCMTWKENILLMVARAFSVRYISIEQCIYLLEINFQGKIIESMKRKVISYPCFFSFYWNRYTYQLKAFDRVCLINLSLRIKELAQRGFFFLSILGFY